MTEPEETDAPDAPPATPAQEPKPETDWKAEAKKWELRAKENKTAAERLTTLEDSQKTEAQKLTDRATAAEDRAAKAEHKMLVAAVALEKGMTNSQARYLQGASEEELSASADQILTDFPSGPRRPNGDVGQGPRDTPAAQYDPKSLADAVIAQRGH